MNKEEFLGQVRQVFGYLTIGQIKLFDVGIKPPSPRVTLASVTHILAKGGNDYGWIRSDWELVFRKQGDAWLLSDVQPLSLYMQPIKDIREIFSRSRQVQ
jgi:hypothetical protein